MINNFTKYNSPTLPGVKLPKIEIEPRHYKELEVSEGISNYEFLRRLCWKGIQSQGIDKKQNAKEYYERVKMELSVFEELSFTDYILLNWEIMNFCREKNIPTNAGRGSAGSSLVLALIGVTKIDPFEYKLFFERFVSKSRARKIIVDGETYLDGSLVPDVDNDIDYSRRPEVMKFIEQKHAGRTCKILTLNTFTGKLCIKEALKIAEGLSEQDVNDVSDTIPKKFGKVLDFEDAIKESEKFKSYTEQYPKAYKIAQKLEGLIKNTGVHPSGIAICHDALENTMPFGRTKDGDLISGYEMNDVASVAIKFDVLGLRTLTVIDEVCRETGVNLQEIDKDDQQTYIFLQNLLAPQGLFQIETDTGFRVCQKVRPKNIHDLSAVLAIARPGALAFADQYAKFSNTGEVDSIHPFFDDILGWTGSIPLYQEQLIAMARKIGFTADEGEQLRRIVGKKKVDQMKEWKDKISNKIIENNLDPKIGEILWKVAEDSANYSFNASHSYCYATCSFYTAYLKVHYPQQFYLALLRMTQHEPDPLAELFKISQELGLFGIKLLPPDLNKSKNDFSIEGKDIRFGLNAMKGVSEKTIEPLLSFSDKSFHNKYEIFQEAKEAGISIGVLCSLIQAGCLDSFGGERCKLVLEAQMFNKLSEKQKLHVIEMGEIHNYDIFAALKDAAAGKIVNSKGKSVFTEKSIIKLREDHSNYKKIYDQNHKHLKFCNWYFEKELLGYSYSHTLREVFEDPKESFTPLLEFSSLDDNTEIRIVGSVTETKKAKSKKDNKYLRMDIADDSAKITALFMDNAREKKYSKFVDDGNVEPKEGDITVIVGKKFGTVLMVDKVSIVTEQIYMRLSQVK